MINERMNQSEILKEFWQDYHETIKPRCFKIVERNKRELMALQKKNPGNWQKMKRLVDIKVRGNHYKVILWSKVTKYQTEIKTCIWFSYIGANGKRRIVLLPSSDTINALILFSPSFFNEWKEQQGDSEEGVELEKNFFLWAEGNYKVYHNEEDRSQVEVDLNNLGAGIGTFKEPGSYLFKHFMGVDLILELQEKVGKILDPLELWNEVHKPKDIVIHEDLYYDYKEDLNNIFDEITKKYG